MPLPATSDRDSAKPGSDKPSSGPVAPKSSFVFRCIGCGTISPTAAQDSRCERCGNLLEITDPSWNPSRLNAVNLKALWRERRILNAALDLSGVWRFRE